MRRCCALIVPFALLAATACPDEKAAPDAGPLVPPEECPVVATQIEQLAGDALADRQGSMPRSARAARWVVRDDLTGHPPVAPRIELQGGKDKRVLFAGDEVARLPRPDLKKFRQRLTQNRVALEKLNESVPDKATPHEYLLLVDEDVRFGDVKRVVDEVQDIKARLVLGFARTARVPPRADTAAGQKMRSYAQNRAAVVTGEAVPDPAWMGIPDQQWKALDARCAGLAETRAALDRPGAESEFGAALKLALLECQCTVDPAVLGEVVYWTIDPGQPMAYQHLPVGEGKLRLSGDLSWKSASAPVVTAARAGGARWVATGEPEAAPRGKKAKRKARGKKRRGRRR